MRQRASAFALYIGGFLGPFGGAVIAVLIPQIGDSLDASRTSVAAGITVYIVPFAVLQLVSGTIGERLGRWRIVRRAYVLYAVASVASALAPDITVFLASRALQGVANAFTTPLLLAGLADAVGIERRGRAVGTFAGVQTAAIAFSPLCGGLLGEIDWRLSFWLVAAVAVALALVPPPPGADPARSVAARFADVLTAQVARLSAIGFAGYAGLTGIAFLVALQAVDAFGLGSAERGLLVAAFGVTGMLAAWPAGAVVDRVGARAVACGGAFLGAAAVVACGLADSAALLAAAWAVAGVGSAALWTGMHTITLGAVPRNTAGATSVVFAFRFGGNAVAPIAWLPIYGVSQSAAFVAAAATAAAAGLMLALLRVSAQPVGPRPSAQA